MSDPAINNRILVIDDNPAIHEDFQKILGRSRAASVALDQAEASIFGDENPTIGRDLPNFCFELDSAYQGREGLGMVQKALDEGRPYAMAFVDVRMPPGWDGIETIRHIWNAYPDLQIVICTAYSDYSWEEMTGDSKKYDSLLILKKPFDNIEVVQMAHALTKKWALTQQARMNMSLLDKLVVERTRDLRATLEHLEAEIAHRTATEDSLRVSEERFSKAFRSSPFPMAIQDLAEDRFEDCNDSFLQMTGHARQDVLDRTSEEIALWPDASTPINIQSLLTSTKSIKHYEVVVRGKDQKLHQTLLAVETFVLGQNRYSLLIWQDLSERVQLEQQLRQSQKMEAVGQLAAGVAHDFNNILTVIQGHASLRLNSVTADEDTRDSLQQISIAADRAATLTRQLLAFSRKQIMQLRGLKLNEIIQGLLSMLHRLIGEHIKLQTNLGTELPAIHADNGSIEQVIMNLVVNARDAMADGGVLSISTKVVNITSEDVRRNRESIQGRFIRLAVQDTGCGMDEATRSHIFEPFFTTKEVGKGTGMGLATVYGIVQQHNGWIEAESTVGKGSIFNVYLPISQVAEEVIEKTGAPIPMAAVSGRETILIVEDEDNLRLLVDTILAEQGYRTLCACNGVEALKIWGKKQHEIDLLLTDIVMPEAITGLQLADRMLVQKPNLKVIYTSGYSLDLISKGHGLRDGQNFLPKPYPPNKLTQAVRTSLDSKPGKSLNARKVTARVPETKLGAVKTLVKKKSGAAAANSSARPKTAKVTR